MTFYDAFAAADPTFHGGGDLAARIRDILRRHAAPVGAKVEALAGLIERGIENSLPIDKIKSGLSALVSALRRRGEDPAADELELLFERVRRYGEGKQIESYSSYLFTVDVDVDF